MNLNSKFLQNKSRAQVMGVYRIDGFLISNVRRLCPFIFGDFYIRADINLHRRTFEIRLRKKIQIRRGDGTKETLLIEDYVDIAAFEKHFGKNWTLMYDTFEEKQ